jgi:hypothetical protein
MGHSDTYLRKIRLLTECKFLPNQYLTKPLCLLSMVKNVTVPLSEVLHVQYFLSSHLSIRFNLPLDSPW